MFKTVSAPHTTHWSQNQITQHTFAAYGISSARSQICVENLEHTLEQTLFSHSGIACGKQISVLRLFELIQLDTAHKTVLLATLTGILNDHQVKAQNGYENPNWGIKLPPFNWTDKMNMSELYTSTNYFVNNWFHNG